MKRHLSILAILLLIFAQHSSPETEIVRRPEHVVLISVDALAQNDISELRNLPVFHEFIDSGAVAQNVLPVYPSVTFPCHTSMVTGMPPSEHGIMANYPLQLGADNPEWYFYASDISTPTIYQLARAEGIKTACVVWPVTAGAEIDYLVPEIWPADLDQNPVRFVARHMSVSTAISLYLRFGTILKQPIDGLEDITRAVDDFIVEAASHVIRRKRPGLMMVHLTSLDAVKHAFGPSSPEALACLAEQDARIGKLLQTVEDAGMTDSTVFIVTGDHGQASVSWKINMNTAFAAEGLIDVLEDETIASWKAAVNPCEGSAHVYVSDPSSLEQVETLLADMVAMGDFTGVASAARSDFYPKGPDFVIEARPGYYFSGDITGDLVVPADQKGAHGYHPDRPEMHTITMALGCTIKPAVSIDGASVMDIGPTIAHILGFSIPNAHGRVLSEFLMPESKEATQMQETISSARHQFRR